MSQNVDSSAVPKNVQDIEFFQGEMSMVLEFDDVNMMVDIKTLNRYFSNVEKLQFTRPNNPTVKTLAFDARGIALLRAGVNKYQVISSESDPPKKQKLSEKQYSEVQRINQIYTGEEKIDERLDEMRKSSEKVGKKGSSRSKSKFSGISNQSSSSRSNAKDCEKGKIKKVKVAWYHRNDVEGKGTYHKQGLPDGGEKTLELMENEDYSFHDIKKRTIKLFFTPRTRGFFEQSFIQLDSNSNKILVDKEFIRGKPKGFWNFYQKVSDEKHKVCLQIKTSWFPGYQDRAVMEILQEPEWIALDVSRKKSVSDSLFSSAHTHSGPPDGYALNGNDTCQTPLQHSESSTASKPVSNLVRNRTRVHQERSPSKVETYIDLSHSSHKDHNQNVSSHKLQPQALDHSNSGDSFEAMVNVESFEDRVRKKSGKEKLLPTQAGPTKPRLIQNKDNEAASNKNMDVLSKIGDGTSKTEIHTGQTPSKDVCSHQQPFKVPTLPLANLKYSSIAQANVKLADEIPVTELLLGQKVGSGTSGQVYAGKWGKTDVAIKVIDILYSRPKQILNEVSALRETSHQNVVQFMGVCRLPKVYYIIMELVKGSDLHTIIHEPGVRAKDYPQLKEDSIAKQISTAMDYLHTSKNFVHRDIKPANMLVTKYYRVKICDLGLMKIRSVAQNDAMLTSTGGNMKFCGTPMYMAPEVLLRKMETSLASDMWSVGVTVVELYSRKDVWDLNEYDPMTDLMTKLKFFKQPDISAVPDFLKDGVQKCFIYNVTDTSKPTRITADEFASYLDDVDDGE
ncbi:hypothetical protein QAD02_008869 [Eretmocerus hayati]|uniref:Uncharacterized protein n=1 Tax=Eretmocerus hayati TaxID=131215 RepID=A0ACC2N831_9HYME|nr:hypothetical protein QAD02_008869 [Eretmocerus hayati]